MKIGKTPLNIKTDGVEATGIIRGLNGQQHQAYSKLPEPCVYCGEPGITKEHIQPVSEGGSGGWTNLAKACLTCNQSRGSKPLLLFLLERQP